jgi:ubiquinone/menaquinone biosynthesis C-methylase UbiE
MVADNKNSSSSNMDAKLVKMEKKDAKFWNYMAENYAKQPIQDEAAYQKKLEITREHFDKKKTAQVLEFGCGTGSTALIHSPYVREIYAIDLSSKMIEIAQEKAKKQGISNVKFDTMGIDRLDVPNDSYDAVLGLSVLHLVPNKDEAIAKIHKILKPGGVFISSTACISEMGAFTGGLVKYIAPVGNYFGIFPKINIFNTKELKDSITNAGFVIEREFHPSNDKAYFLVAKKK